MATTPTSNAGSTFFNINQCRSFSMLVTSSLTCLSSVDTGGHGVGQPCSEVIIVNRTGGDLTVYDQNFGPFAGSSPKGAGASRGFVLEDNDSFTFRGLTNVNEVSATATSTGPIYYRAQFFSNNPSR
tara:strand:- start:17559 stop:17939 length:381 start_codon:yes stop_codon:yes gene_type:complete